MANDDARDPRDNEGAGGEMGDLIAELMKSLVMPEDEGGETDEGPAGFDGRALDVSLLGRGLIAAGDPLAQLRGLVEQVEGAEAPSPFSQWVARRLREAGIFETDTEMPQVSVVRVKTSGLFYIRCRASELTYLAALRILSVESALNVALLAQGRLEDVNAACDEELVRFECGLCSSVAAQAGHASPVGESGEAYPRHGGEWDARFAICEAMESFRMPWRLSYKLRVNVAAGAAAIEIDYVEPRLMPAQLWSAELGVVPSTADMRAAAARDYNLRVVVLCAANALMRCPQLSEVWVACVSDTPRGFSCLCSTKMRREDLASLDLAGFDPVEFLRGTGAVLDVRDGELQPVKQGFSVNDQRFCPAKRYAPIETSEARLSTRAAAGLGVQRVADLGCDQLCELKELAKQGLCHFDSSTENNVHWLLELRKQAAEGYSVEAINRTISGLLEGDVADDAEAINDALLGGTELDRAVKRADGLIAEGKNEEARDVLLAALRPIDQAGIYQDGAGVYWRHFDRYADRALWNRMVAPTGIEVRLVPDSYLEAHLLVSVACLACRMKDESLEHARRAARLAPLSLPVSLNLSQMLASYGDMSASDGELCRLLSMGHDPETLGVGYIRLAMNQWQQGRMRVAQACYQMAAKWVPAQIIHVGTKIASLLGASGPGAGEELSDAHVREALGERGIPLAPCDDVLEVLRETAQAAIDEEIFWTGKSALHFLCCLTSDDVENAVLSSLESEPDE